MRVYITRYSRHLALMEHVVCCSFGNTAGNLFFKHRHPKLEIRALLRIKSHYIMALVILGDSGADSGGEGKSKQAEKYGTKEK